MPNWIEVCGTDDLDQDDVIRFDYEELSYAIYRTSQNRYYATAGFCTHQKVHLAGGIVIGNMIECPKHNGRFDFTTGEAKRIPACLKLEIYTVKIETDKIFIWV